MAALTSERNTREVFCNALNLHRVKEIAEGSVIHPGAIVALNAAGKAVPASDTANLVVIGRADAFTVNGKIIVKSGMFIYDNAASGDALGNADINRLVYVVDDHTVGKNGGSNKIPCGILRDILSPSEVIVEIGNHFLVPAGTTSSADSTEA